jgi:pimeloyl-ACP methyl ester carboxylesterase
LTNDRPLPDPTAVIRTLAGIIGALCILDACAYAQALQSCTIEGRRGRCGEVVVPEDRATPNGRRLALRVVRLEKTGNGPAGDPVFVLAGGPGQAATSLAPWAARTFGPILERHDLVFFDQRGTAGDHRLDCPLAPRTFFVPVDPARCAARLSRSAAIRRYGTADFVEDIDAARQALGYDRIVLYGMSYGTRAAYAYARRYPTRVSAAVLVAPAPVSVPLFDSFDEDSRRSFDAIVADCLTDSQCGKAFPTLRRDAERLHETIVDPNLVLGIRFLQYGGAAALPRLMAEAAAGNTTPLETAAEQFRQRLTAEIAIGAHLTIMCGEDLPFGNTSRPTTLREQFAAACRDWPAAPVPDDFHEAERLSVPALVIAGEWDPITPPRLAAVAAEQFTPSHVVIVPKGGHTLEGYGKCIASIVDGFLTRGVTDRACLSAVRRPAYEIR